jgi:hypothetical protein
VVCDELLAVNDDVDVTSAAIALFAASSSRAFLNKSIKIIKEFENFV